MSILERRQVRSPPLSARVLVCINSRPPFNNSFYNAYVNCRIYNSFKGTIGGAPFTDTADAGALCPVNDSPDSIMSRLLNFFSEKDAMKKRHEEQLTALTLQNSALEEEMQHSKIM